MTFNPAQPRDDQGQWTDAGGSVGVSVAHSSTGHNDHISSVARSFLSGAIQGAKVSSVIGAGIGGVLGTATGGPIGGVTGVITGGFGGGVSGFVSGGTARVIEAHPGLFGEGRGGTVAKMTLGVVGGIAGAFAGSAAGAAAGRTFYGGARGAGFRDSSSSSNSSSSDRQGGPQYKSFSDRMADFKARQEQARTSGVANEKARMAARMAAERARDPMERRLDALRAKAADRGIGDAERRAFQAKADEILKKHRGFDFDRMTNDLMRRHGMRANVRDVATR